MLAPTHPIQETHVDTLVPARSDEELMALITGGDQRALGMLYDRYQPLLAKIIGEILPGEADAEETLQDVFMEIWKRADRFDASRGKPLGWIICMARRRAIDRYRKVRRQLDHVEPLEGLSGDVQNRVMRETGDGSRGTDQPASHDLRAVLLGLLQSLPDGQRDAIYLTYFREMSQREVAAHTGIPLGTIKTRIDLAMRKILQRSTQLRQDLN